MPQHNLDPHGGLQWGPDPDSALTVWAIWGQADTHYTLHWGDGTHTRMVMWQPPAQHTYPDPGAYTITAVPDTGESASAQVVVRSTTTPGVSGNVASDNSAFYNLTINDDDAWLLSWFRLDWGDGSTVQHHPGSPGAVASHGYDDGVYTIVCTDIGTRRVWRREITIDASKQDPQVEFTAPAPTSQPRRVRATLTGRAYDAPVLLDWGDGSTTRPQLAQVGATADHTYAADGIYIIQGWYSTGAGDGAAWDVTVPLTRGTRPTSQLVIVPDTLNDRAIWAKYAGSVTDYTLHWGDGTQVRRTPRQPPVRHVYQDYGTYLVRGVNDHGTERSEHVTLAPPDPPPPGPTPAVALHRLHGTYDMLWMRLLFSPGQGDDYDHRIPAHTVDWDDGTVEEVPAGAPHADHQYAGQVWPHGQGFPQVQVTDRTSGKTVTASASELRKPLIDFDKMTGDNSSYTPPEWSSWATNLPTKGPATSYQVHNSGRLIRSQAPQYDNASYFYFRHTYPDGWSSSTLVGPDGAQLDSGVVLSDSGVVHNHVCAYDWDWQGDPRLIRVTPFHHGTGRWWEFHVDWGDAANEKFAVSGPDPGARDADTSEPILGGSNPRSSHWYPTPGVHTLTVWARLRDGDGEWNPPTSRVLGPCSVTPPTVDPSDALAVHLDFLLQDAYHPVRVDWGDGTPVTRNHPAGASGGNSGRLTHRYPRSGSYTITVYAPMQDHRVFTATVGTKEKKHMAFKATYTPTSQWWGGYSASYRITNQGTEASTWELSFTLEDPARVQDVWGAGQVKRHENRQHKPGKAKASTEPPLALYRHATPTGTGTLYVIKCTQPVGPGDTVDVGFRVESGQEQTPEPRQCSINGGACTGEVVPPPTDPPSPPTQLKVTNTGPRTISLGWAPSNQSGLRHYEVSVDGDVYTQVPAPASSGTVTKLDPQTEYELRVRAVDTGDNTSLWTQPVKGVTTEDTPAENLPWLAKVAPFVDMGLWPTPQLQGFANESGVNAFNLGFITAVSAHDCTAVWAGQAAYAVQDQWQRDNIAGFHSAPGRYPIISFGGETGTELAQAATNVEELYAQYKLVIDTYGLGDAPHHIDFDIEGAAQKDEAANVRRAAAVRMLQKQFPQLRVGWTLPVLPEGLTQDGLGVLRAAYNAGVRIDLVNIMTMYFYRNEDMGVLVKQAAESLHSQLVEFFPGMAPKQRWSKVSVCPMIGQCGDGSIYSLEHAADTAAFAASKRLGQLTYWEAGRDRNACLSESLYQCTNIPQDPWDFADAFRAYQPNADK